MPELPEVETIRKGLEQKIKNKKITSVEVRWSGVTKGHTTSLKSGLINNKFILIDRIGKLLIFNVSHDQYLLVHLKMTGQLVYQDGENVVAGGHKLADSDLDVPNKHTSVIIKFTDKSALYFSDMRKFGYVKLVSRAEKDVIVNKFGIEPLTSNFNLKSFKKILQNKKTTIKAILLNQTLIAGIGNIYVDEICFVSGVLPNRNVNSLTAEEINKICKNIEFILKKAIKYGGTTFRDYINHNGDKGNFTRFLQVYGRQGKKCNKCQGGIIKKIKVAGRGTHYCSVCQK